MPPLRLVGIPVRGSKSVLKILPQIASWATTVRIYATDVDFRNDPLPPNVEVHYDVPALAEARHELTAWSVEKGADFIYQIDDDTEVNFEDALTSIEYRLLTCPYLGAVCTTPELLAFYSKGRISNKGFLLVPSPTQVWGLRLDAYCETDGFTTVETMEDIFVGLSMWKLGYATATLPYLRHKHKRPRLSNKRVGGTPPSERDGYMESCKEVLRQRFEGNMLKSISLSQTKEGISKLSPRYDWSKMGYEVVARWGHIGYSDGRMSI